ncbi:MAG: signal recognition particle protein [Deltaproteobacteria bacterium]|nr:signal recognition particle protein [Deltaproteobacteria bacterium]
MFDNLSDKLNLIFKNLKGEGKLTEKNIELGLKEVRMALLEADVHYSVVKKIISDIKKRSIGKEVLSSLTPAQQVIKIINEELTTLMGGANKGLTLNGPSPVPIMLVGLQGSGKTTTAAKLALFLRKKGKKPYLVPADIYRPAAIEQLTKLANQIDIPVFFSKTNMDVPTICKEARLDAQKNEADVLIIDTAGRLHINNELMKELINIKTALSPSDILLVADAMTGQDAVNIAKAFDDLLDIGGVILTKMDGDARGGAALSIKSIAGKPIKFIGVGEKLNALELFHPDRIASRILGMGDVLSLIEKAEEAIDKKKAAELEKRLRKNRFTLEDFKNQMLQIRKIGSIADIMKMIPGLGNNKKLKNVEVDEKEFIKIEVIINSMTKEEKKRHTIINGSRRKRIAKGSGTSVQEVNRLLKNYNQIIDVIKKMNKTGMKKFIKSKMLHSI